MSSLLNLLPSTSTQTAPLTHDTHLLGKLYPLHHIASQDREESLMHHHMRLDWRSRVYLSYRKSMEEGIGLQEKDPPQEHSWVSSWMNRNGKNGNSDPSSTVSDFGSAGGWVRYINGSSTQRKKKKEKKPTGAGQWFSRKGSSYTSDAGWGCLIRSGQMMMAEALVRLYLGRNWRRMGSQRQMSEHEARYLAVQETLYYEILDMFYDSNESPLSIHRICRWAASEYGKKVGSWFSPTLIACVFRDLVLKQSQVAKDRDIVLPKCYICMDGMLFLDEVQQQFSDASRLQHATEYNDDFHMRGEEVFKLDMEPFVILIPLKLGQEDKVNPVYNNAILQALQCTYTLGIAGGTRRNHSLYFIGYEHGKKGSGAPHLVYLDPHITQKVSRDPSTYHSTYEIGPKCLPISGMDPCMVMGFMVRTREELDDFLAFARENFCGEAPILSIEEKRPRSVNFTEKDVTLSDDDDEWSLIE